MSQESEQQPATNLRFDFSSTAFEKQPFSVVELEGFEAISKPFRFTLTLVAHEPDLDIKKMLANPATLRIHAPDGRGAVPYHGILAEFHQLHQVDGYVFYQAVLVPRLWRLSLWRVSEAYLHEQTIPDIVAKVLEENHLLGGDDFELKIKSADDYRKRSLVYQYQESYFDFISRWMEKEGMYYFFTHDGTADKMVIVDDKLMLPADALKLKYLPDDHDSDLVPDALQSFTCRYQPLPKKVVVRSFNYRKAAVALKCSHEISADGVGEVIYHGENFRTEARGQRYARLRAEEILCGGEVFSGKGTAVGLRTGCFIDTSGHYHAQFNGRYLVTEIHHHGSQAGALLGSDGDGSGGKQGEIIYRNDFRAIPASVQFRPARTTPKPRISGTLYATIDAEGDGLYAELDEHGQYRVQLPTDHANAEADQGPAHLRMASPYAGAEHGVYFPLHKGTEVLLSFEDGDPDLPVIVSAVPNSETPSLVTSANPTQNLIRTHGGNYVKMEDTQGQQSISISSPHAGSFIQIGAAAMAAAAAQNGGAGASAAATPDDSGAAGDAVGGVKISTAENTVISAGKNAQSKVHGLVSGVGNFVTSVDRNYVQDVGADATSTIAGKSKTTIEGAHEFFSNHSSNSSYMGLTNQAYLGNYAAAYAGAYEAGYGGAYVAAYAGAVANTYAGAVVNTYVGEIANAYVGNCDSLYVGNQNLVALGSSNSTSMGMINQANMALVSQLNLIGAIVVNTFQMQEAGISMVFNGLTMVFNGVQVGANGVSIQVNGINLSASALDTDDPIFKSTG